MRCSRTRMGRRLRLEPHRRLVRPASGGKSVIGQTRSVHRQLSALHSEGAPPRAVLYVTCFTRNETRPYWGPHAGCPGKHRVYCACLWQTDRKGIKKGESLPLPQSQREEERRKKTKVPVLLLMMIQYGGAKAANSTDQTLCPAISINTYNTNPISIQ